MLSMIVGFLLGFALLALADEFFDDETKTFGLNLEDDILAGCVITHDGSITNDMLNNAYKGA